MSIWKTYSTNNSGLSIFPSWQLLCYCITVLPTPPTTTHHHPPTHQQQQHYLDCHHSHGVSTNMPALLAAVCESWYGDLGLCISHHLAGETTDVCHQRDTYARLMFPICAWVTSKGTATILIATWTCFALVTTWRETTDALNHQRDTCCMLEQFPYHPWL